MRSKKRIKPFLKWIENEWSKSEDQRFGQLLINLGLVEDSVGMWNLEISDYDIPHKTLREILTWGTYGKNKKCKYKEVYLKDLDVEHIKSILKTQTHIKGTGLERYLKEEIKYRKKLK